MSSYKLTYLNVRALAETSRILFYLAKQPYEGKYFIKIKYIILLMHILVFLSCRIDYRYPVDLATMHRPEFDADQAKGKFAIALDRLPILTVDGKFELAQSKSIERYLAKKFGFFGATLEEEGTIDMLTEHIRDIKQKYHDSVAGKTGEEVNNAKHAFITEQLPKWLGKLELVVESDTYSVGNKLTLADVTIQQFLHDYLDDKETVAAIVAKYPKLRGITATVTEAAKGWLESRPVTIR